MLQWRFSLLLAIVLACLSISMKHTQALAGLQAVKAYASYRFKVMSQDCDLYELIDEFKAAEGNSVDFYSWIGVPSTCSIDIIAQAHRQRAVALHPAVEPANRIQFRRLNRIVSTLVDPRTRKLYDQHLANDGHWRGVLYYMRRYRTAWLFVALVLGSGLLEYLQAWLHYATETSRLNKFLQDASNALEKLPKEHAARRRSGRSYIDFDGQVLQCEFRPDLKDILVYDQDGRKVRLSERLSCPALQDHVWWIYVPQKAGRLFWKHYIERLRLSRHEQVSSKAPHGSFT